MELWIRSQDKRRLGKIIYLELNNDDYGFYIMGWIDKFEGTIIATYKTKERALEVLDEIQNILKPQLIIKDSGKIIGSFEDTLVREGATYELKELSTFVYQMPED